MAAGEPSTRTEGDLQRSSSLLDAEQSNSDPEDGGARRRQRITTQHEFEIQELRTKLIQSKQNYTHVMRKFGVLQAKYGILKATIQEIFFDHLPNTSPEFESLCVKSGACSLVQFVSDSQIDQFNVAYLGEGRYGTVLHGQTRGLDGSVTQVAMKSIAKARVRSLTSLRNLVNEIACMRQLTHAKAAVAPESAEAMELDHIVSLHSVRISSESVYLEQSFGGSDLFSIISRRSRDAAPLPTVAIVAIVRGLARGVAAVHHSGWCHRDIKPENILLGADAKQLLSALDANDAAAAAAQIHVRLCDFGVCASLRGPPLQQFCGSPGFFAPELADMARGPHVNSGSPLTVASCCLDDDDAGSLAPSKRGSYDGAAADVFSMGATLLEMLVGTQRFTAMWASKYHNYALCNRRDLESSLAGARNAVEAVLQSSPAADATETPPAAHTMGCVGGQSPKALALECLELDPRKRPTSDAILAAVFPALCPVPPADVVTRSSGRGHLPHCRRHYPRKFEGDGDLPLFVMQPQAPVLLRAAPLPLRGDDEQRPHAEAEVEAFVERNMPHNNGALSEGIASLPSVQHVQLVG